MRVPHKAKHAGRNPVLLLRLLYDGRETGALTVAGQWRSSIAFPNILAIAMMSDAEAQRRSNDVMETTSVTSTFIAGSTGGRQRGKSSGGKKDKAGRIEENLIS